MVPDSGFATVMDRSTTRERDFFPACREWCDAGMPVVPDDIAGLLASRKNGTLATLRRDGRPQLSVVTYAWYPDDDGREIVRISTVDGRAKVANLRRDPRASFLV